MTDKVKISIVIPTRTRATYLKGCLQSVLIAADKAECPVEIIVADNASSDETRSVIAGFNSPIITYFRQPERVSMRQNFEDGLTHSTGSHVMFIGDDDGILPNGLRLLYALIAAHDPDVVKWRKLNFKWPNDAEQIPGHLVIRYMKLSGMVSKVDHKALLEKFFQGTHRDYSDGAGIYHGCISRRLIDKVKAASQGSYFWCSMPDVYTSVANLLATDRDILKIDRPISLPGASPRSTGDSAVRMATKGDAGKDSDMNKYIREAKNDPYRSHVPDECMSIQLHLLAALELACKMQNVPFAINHKSWEKVVTGELSGFAPEMVTPCMEGAKRLLGDLDLTTAARDSRKTTTPHSSARAQSDILKAPQKLNHRISKTTISGGEHMGDIVKAAQFVDDLVGNDDLQKALHPPAAILGILGIRKKLRQLGP